MSLSRWPFLACCHGLVRADTKEPREKKKKKLAQVSAEGLSQVAQAGLAVKDDSNGIGTL